MINVLRGLAKAPDQAVRRTSLAKRRGFFLFMLLMACALWWFVIPQVLEGEVPVPGRRARAVSIDNSIFFYPLLLFWVAAGLMFASLTVLCLCSLLPGLSGRLRRWAERSEAAERSPSP